MIKARFKRFKGGIWCLVINSSTNCNSGDIVRFTRNDKTTGVARLVKHLGAIGPNKGLKAFSFEEFK